MDGENFNAEKGAEHILAGFTAIVAGRYRQLQEREEGKRGMDEVADLNTRFGGKEFRPTNEEIDLCRDHALEVEQRSPANPVDPSLFTDARWKAMQKAQGPMAEQLTGNKNCTLSMDPNTMERQLVLFKKEVLELGWPV